MITRHMIALGIFGATLVTSVGLAAAPFCVVTSYSKNCWYYSYSECEQAAGTQGACIINQDEAQAPSSGGAPFCVVASYGTNCMYFDAQSCQQAAASQDAVCAVNPNAVPPR